MRFGLKKIFSGIKRRIAWRIYKLKREFYYLFEALRYWLLIRRYNASVNTDCDIDKMKYSLLRETHVIEKGLSMKNPRDGFGQQKVRELLARLTKFENIYGDEDSCFINEPLSTIYNYIMYMENSGIEIECIKNEYQKLIDKNKIRMGEEKGGYHIVESEDILKKAQGTFEELLKSRHSIRYFTDEKISNDVIYKGLSLAQLTPSACNRQGWHTHVYQDELSQKLAKWQGGCNGFENEIKTSILVTADLKAFLSHEVFQAYIDGGLFAMNLINSFHYLGIGTMPLSCGFERKKLSQLKEFGVPENEIPIAIIGLGCIPPKVKVAASLRKPIQVTNTFHD